MKKFIAIFVMVFMLVSVVFANGTVPKFLTSPMTNYTADYDISINFDNSEEISKLLAELEMLDEVSYIFDMEMLLRTLLTCSGKMSVQTNMSDDFSKIQLALTSDSEHSISFNSNLNMNIDSKTGMWIDMDLSNEENPVFDMVYKLPFFNKYMKVSNKEILSDNEMVSVFSSVYNKEYMDSLQKIGMELFVKHSTVKGTAAKYTFKMDNEGFVGFLNELMPLICDFISEFDETMELPDFSGLTFLGEDGITTEVVLSGGKIKTEKINADISIDLSKLYPILSGMPWEYQSAKTIDFTFSINANVSNVGKTKVNFPKLTEENSFKIEDLYDSQDEEFDYMETDVPQYPMWYVDEVCDNLFIIDDEVYVPLRQTLEAAYEESILIDYNNDKITMSCDYFSQFDKMTININSDKALVDGKEVKIMKPILYKDRTYVSSTFFTDILGWEFWYASHDLVDDCYQYSFYTDMY